MQRDARADDLIESRRGLLQCMSPFLADTVEKVPAGVRINFFRAAGALDVLEHGEHFDVSGFIQRPSHIFREGIASRSRRSAGLCGNFAEVPFSPFSTESTLSRRYFERQRSLRFGVTISAPIVVENCAARGSDRCLVFSPSNHRSATTPNESRRHSAPSHAWSPQEKALP